MFKTKKKTQGNPRASEQEFQSKKSAVGKVSLLLLLSLSLHILHFFTQWHGFKVRSEGSPMSLQTWW